jgi:hypothetical protein
MRHPYQKHPASLTVATAMAEHHHERSSEHRHNQRGANRGLHKDWRTWAVVLLMLAAMGAYVLSLDEEDAPSNAGDPLRVPAAAE